MHYLTVEEQLNLLDLHKEEICARIAQNLNLDALQPLSPFMHRKQLELWLDKRSDEKRRANGECANLDQEREERQNEYNQNIQIGMEIWQHLKKSFLHEQLYAAVLEFLNPIDEELHTSLSLQQEKSVVGLKKILPHSSKIISLFNSDGGVIIEDPTGNWHKFMDILSKTVDEYQKVDRLSQRVRDGEMSIEKAMRILLRCLPLVERNGYEHLLNALICCGSERATKLVQSIHADFPSQYELVKSLLTTADNDDSINTTNDFLEMIQMRRKIPRIYTRACCVDIVNEHPINLRPYQEELAKEAVEGKNVIICAPTGSGKTIVGAFIVREHLINAIQSGQKAKACFIVPTNALVHQQTRLFDQKIGHFAKVHGLSGEHCASLKNPIQMSIQRADMVIMTPQLLINELQKRPTEENMAFKLFSLDTFSLIIFDETHHSKDEHPYNVLMSHYQRMKQTGTFNDKLPQIIGMTASLGTGGSNSRDLGDAIRFALEICANMDAKWISTVRHQLNNLRQFIPDVKEEIQFVEDQNQHLEFLRGKIVKQIEWQKSLMNQIPEANHPEISLQLNDRNGRDPLEQCFEHWLSNLRQRYLKECPNLSDESRERLAFCVDQMLIFYYAIILLNLFGSSTTLNYIQKEEEEKLAMRGAMANAQQIREWLAMFEVDIQAINEQCQRNSPLFNRLIQILNGQFIRSQNSRVLIFLKQLDHCEILSSLLNEQIEHRTDFITGQASRDEAGQNVRIQQAMLEDFSIGKIKILCATTVAEEGIDISECNLIVHYNYVTNEIARIQRRGRGRAQYAESILLTFEPKIKEKEEQNESRENLMKQALDELSHWTPADFQQKVDVLAKSLYETRMGKEALDRRQAEELQQRDTQFKIRCCQCNTFLCSSTSIARANDTTYVIADREFWRRMKTGCTGPLPPEKANSRECLGRMPHVGEHRCSCNAVLGRIIQCRDGILLPNLKAERLVFVRCQPDGTELSNGSGRFSAKKWSKLATQFFHIEMITHLQLTEMKDAPNRPEALLRVDLQIDENANRLNNLNH